MNEVSGGSRHKKTETVLRQCVDEVDPKLQETSSSKLWTLQETWTEDSSFDCVSLVDQPHVVRKICWKTLPKGRHIPHFSCGSAANCATALKIVKLRLRHTTRPVIQVVPGQTVVYARIWRFQGVGLQVETAVKPEKKPPCTRPKKHVHLFERRISVPHIHAQ